MIPTRPTPSQHPLNPSKAKASPLSAKAPAKRPLNDRTASAPLPLSPREQQVCEYLAQGITFETIARHLSCSPAAARAYHRRALDKHQRTITLAPLEPNDRNAKAQPEPTSAELPRDRPAFALASICNRSPFHSPAVDAPALLERPSPLELCVPSLFVTGDRVANGEYVHGRSHSPQTTTTETPPRPRRRKRSSRRSRRVGVGFCVAAAAS